MLINDSAAEPSLAAATDNAEHTRMPLLAGLCLGVAADLLAWANGPAVSGFASWVLLMALVLCNHARLKETANLVHVLGWCAVACLAALVLAIRTTPIFIPVMWLLMLIAVVMIGVKHLQPEMPELRIPDLLNALIHTLLRLLSGLPLLLVRLDLPASTRSNVYFLPIVRGLLLTAPLLLVFLALFSSADATFDRYTSFLTDWLTDNFLSHVARIGIFVWLISGLLASLLHTLPGRPAIGELKPCIGKTETTIVMASLAVLFTAFVLIQLGYLFGGRATIEASTGLTIAAYARRGFYELLTAGGLTLALLLGMAALSVDKTRFRQLALVLVACVLIMLGSAVQRMLLYISEFGFSLDRVIASTVLAWLCLVLIAFALTVLRAQPRWFIQAAVTTGVFAALFCAFLNPAAVVARVNIERSLSQHKSLDMQYLLSLGADAVPLLVRRIEELPRQAQCLAAQVLLAQWPGTDELSAQAAPSVGTENGVETEPGWRSFHLGRWQARKTVEEHRNKLQNILEDTSHSGEGPSICENLFDPQSLPQ